MTPKETKYHISWAGQPTSEDAFIDSATKYTSHTQRLKENLGSALMTVENLCTGITLFHWQITFAPKSLGRRIPHLEFTATYPERSLIIRSLIGSNVEYQDADLGYGLTINSNIDLYRFAIHEQYKIYLHALQDCHLIHLLISETQLTNLLGKMACCKLLKKIGLISPNSATLNHVPHAPYVLRKLICPKKYDSQDKALIAKEIILQYLTSIESDFPGVRGGIANDTLSSLMINIRNRVVQSDNRGPTLAELGKEYQISCATLNRQFKRQFLESFHKFSNSQRLAKAHFRILNTSKAIKQISADLSYKHVSYFNAAFKKYYGCSPYSLRTQKPGEGI